MLDLDSRFAACQKESFQSLVFEAADHATECNLWGDSLQDDSYSPSRAAAHTVAFHIQQEPQTGSGHVLGFVSLCISVCEQHCTLAALALLCHFTVEPRALGDLLSLRPHVSIAD